MGQRHARYRYGLFSRGRARLLRAPQLPASPKTVVTANRTVATEQEWIVGDVVGAIAGIARPTSAISVKVTRGTDVGGHSSFDVALAAGHQQVTVVSHLWSPDTYEPMTQHLLGDVHVANDTFSSAALLVLSPGGGAVPYSPDSRVRSGAMPPRTASQAARSTDE